jgi:hypothetical protein
VNLQPALQQSGSFRQPYQPEMPGRRCRGNGRGVKANSIVAYGDGYLAGFNRQFHINPLSLRVLNGVR